MSQQECQCVHCTRLQQLQNALLSTLTELGVNEEQDVELATRILQDMRSLHESISTKHKATEVTGQSESIQLPTNITMMCDHCALHDLDCGGYPVCHSCQSIKCPCIRRWCVKRTDCKDGTCKYAHTNRLPVDQAGFDIGDYIVLPGNLPDTTGRSLGKGMKRPISASVTMPTVDEVKQKQDETRQQLEEICGGDEENARQLHYPCGNVCNRSFFSKQGKVPSGDFQRMQAVANKLLGKSR